MTRLVKIQMLAAVCILCSGDAGAQSACPEGRAANGACVNQGLAESMRQAAMIYSQPKLSYTHYPILPSGDWIFRYPNQVSPDPAQPGGTLTPLSSGR